MWSIESLGIVVLSIVFYVVTVASTLGALWYANKMADRRLANRMLEKMSVQPRGVGGVPPLAPGVVGADGKVDPESPLADSLEARRGKVRVNVGAN